MYMYGVVKCVWVVMRIRVDCIELWCGGCSVGMDDGCKRGVGLLMRRYATEEWGSCQDCVYWRSVPVCLGESRVNYVSIGYNGNVIGDVHVALAVWKVGTKCMWMWVENLHVTNDKRLLTFTRWKMSEVVVGVCMQCGCFSGRMVSVELYCG